MYCSLFQTTIMAPRWATIALCISALVASAHAAALPTQDEYVVSADSSHKVSVYQPEQLLSSLLWGSTGCFAREYHNEQRFS